MKKEGYCYIGIVICIILLPTGSVTAQQVTIECTCEGSCHGTDISTKGVDTFGIKVEDYYLLLALPQPLNLAVIIGNLFINNPIEVDANAKKKCLESWGTKCGGLTGCYKDCESNCNAWCNGLEDDFSVIDIHIDLVLIDLSLEMPIVERADVKTSCMNSCKDKCEFNSMIYEVINMIIHIIGIVASIMFVIYGYKFITSSSPEERDKAKSSLMYVIFAIFMVVIAESLMTFFIELVVGNICDVGTPLTQPTPICPINLLGIPVNI